MLFDYEVLGQEIRRMRIERKLTQEVLSGLAGISRTHLTMIERGSIHANIETIWKLSSALGIRPSFLFARIEERIGNAD